MKEELERLAERVEEFQAAGGSVVGPVKEKKQLKSWRAQLRRRKEGMEEERYKMVLTALSCNDLVLRDVYVALDSQAKVVGAAMSDEFYAYKSRHVEFLGATGEIKGAGAALLVAACRDLVEGWGLGVDGVGVEEYYEGLGMEEARKGMTGVSHWWTPEEVREIQEFDSAAIALAI